MKSEKGIADIVDRYPICMSVPLWLMGSREFPEGVKVGIGGGGIHLYQVDVSVLFGWTQLKYWRLISILVDGYLI